MLRKGFKAEAERHAAQFRKHLGIKEQDPLPARQLAEHLSIQLLTPNDIPGIDEELLEALLIAGKDYWSAAIFLKEGKEYICTQRFTGTERF